MRRAGFLAILAAVSLSPLSPLEARYNLRKRVAYAKRVYVIPLHEAPVLTKLAYPDKEGVPITVTRELLSKKEIQAINKELFRIADSIFPGKTWWVPHRFSLKSRGKSPIRYDLRSIDADFYIVANIGKEEHTPLRYSTVMTRVQKYHTIKPTVPELSIYIVEKRRAGSKGRTLVRWESDIIPQEKEVSEIVGDIASGKTARSSGIRFVWKPVYHMLEAEAVENNFDRLLDRLRPMSREIVTRGLKELEMAAFQKLQPGLARRIESQEERTGVPLLLGTVTTAHGFFGEYATLPRPGDTIQLDPDSLLSRANKELLVFQSKDPKRTPTYIPLPGPIKRSEPNEQLVGARKGYRLVSNPEDPNDLFRIKIDIREPEESSFWRAYIIYEKRGIVDGVITLEAKPLTAARN